MLHRACRLTKKWSGGALANPIADTELPSWSLDDKTQVRAPGVSEIRRILEGAAKEDVRVAVALRVLATTGMRRGEVCALRCSDLDVDGRTVRVDESVVTARGGAVVKAPKTRASIRRISVDAATVEALSASRVSS